MQIRMEKELNTVETIRLMKECVDHLHNEENMTDSKIANLVKYADEFDDDELRLISCLNLRQTNFLIAVEAARADLTFEQFNEVVHTMHPKDMRTVLDYHIFKNDIKRSEELAKEMFEEDVKELYKSFGILFE